MNEWTRYLQLLGRTLIGIIFLWGGVAKAMSFDATAAYIAQAGLPFPSLACTAAIVFEGITGILFLIGYQIRATSIALAIYCVITAFVFHRNLANPLQYANFVKNFLILGGLLAFAHNGAGFFSVEERLQRKPNSRSV
jgi:putative oxidoreductase